jgi:GNAT superfamily N-acetyltransferase
VSRPSPIAAAAAAEDLARVRVRRAVDADARTVAEAVRELLLELGGTPPDVVTMETAARTVIAEEDAGVVLIAERADGDGAAAGVLAATWIVAVHAGGTYGLIQDLWVDRELRGAGVGALLVAELCAVAQVRGAGRIEVGIPRESFAGLAATRRFYEREGFAVVGTRLRRRLEP